MPFVWAEGTPRGFEKDTQMDVWIVKAQRPGMALIKIFAKQGYEPGWEPKADFTFLP